MLQGVAADCNSAGRKPMLGSIPRQPTKHAQVAQLVEHGIEDPGVGGSIPSLGTI